MDKPVIKKDPLYQLLRTEDIKSFNEQRDQLNTSELKNGDYRGRDLRNMKAQGLDSTAKKLLKEAKLDSTDASKAPGDLATMYASFAKAAKVAEAAHAARRPA